MSETLSVVIAAKNCQDRITGTVMPWKTVATEIIVVDQFSHDKTAEIASQLGCKVIQNNPPGDNFDINRKKGMLEASSDWVLYIDTDERPTSALLDEIKYFLLQSSTAFKDTNGVKIPNEFYFLGKPLRHGLYNPRSAEIRMMRRGKWEYPCEDGFHRGVSVQGGIHRFSNSYKHFNVNTLSEWFIKTNQYTEHDAEKYILNNPDGPVKTYFAFIKAMRFFMRHYFWKLGFLDGFHGLVSVFYFMLYHLTLDIKKWEKSVLSKKKNEQDFLSAIKANQR